MTATTSAGDNGASVIGPPSVLGPVDSEVRGDRLRRPRRSRTARALIAALLLAPPVAAAGVELGGLQAVSGAVGDAQRYRDTQAYDRAVAVYRAVAAKTGPLYLLARTRVDAADVDAQRTLLDWARALAATGRVDDALAAVAQVTDPALVPERQREAAEIALADARTQSAAGHFDVALRRLDAVLAGLPPPDLASQAQALHPACALGAAQLLLQRGEAAGAVTALDDLIAAVPASAEAARALALLPDAVLAAGRQAIAHHDEAVALRDLNRILARFPGSPQARTAQELLAAPQPVQGTLVRHDGGPVAGAQVRLGSHYRAVYGGYETQPPYYVSRTNDHGDFSFGGVPLGEYVVEVQQGDGWTTILTPEGQPAYRVAVESLTPVDLAFVVVPGS
jgi:tetratricopeptide (TPR) repeat protein